MHDICVALREQGIEATVFCGLSLRQSGGARYMLQVLADPRRGLARDVPYGYPVFRARDPVAAVSRLVRLARPSVAVLNPGGQLALAEQFIESGVPVIVYIRDALFHQLDGPVYQGPDIRYVTNSEYLARRFAEVYGITPTCIPPLVQPERYRVEPKKKNVTFICPIPQKGLEIASRLAACRRDIPFVFVESWSLRAVSRLRRYRHIRKHGNITLRNSTDDMRDVYRDAKIVLVPSLWDEGWGRVVSEAQLSGIPILASNRGGLPESVGPGGVLVDPSAGFTDWERALSRIWDDPAEYERLAALALQHARRPEFEPQSLITRLLALITELVDTSQSRRRNGMGSVSEIERT